MTDSREPGLDRRTFLRRGLFGGLLLGLGALSAGGLGWLGWLSGRRGRAVPLPAEGLEALSPEEYAVMHALAGRLATPVQEAAPSDAAGVALRADRALAMADPSARREVKQLLGILESAAFAFFFHGLRTPFSALGPAEQDRVLEGWRFSALTLKRTGYQALRTLVLASAYASPARWADIGYPGPPAGFARPGRNAPP